MALSVPTWTKHGLGHWIKTQLFGSMLSQSMWLKDMRHWARYLMVGCLSPEIPQKERRKAPLYWQWVFWSSHTFKNKYFQVQLEAFVSTDTAPPHAPQVLEGPSPKYLIYLHRNPSLDCCHCSGLCSYFLKLIYLPLCPSSPWSQCTLIAFHGWVKMSMQANIKERMVCLAPCQRLQSKVGSIDIGLW